MYRSFNGLTAQQCQGKCVDEQQCNSFYAFNTKKSNQQTTGCQLYSTICTIKQTNNVGSIYGTLVGA